MGGDASDGHCLAVVGYTEDYWIIRNSWGSSWGQDGYMYFQRGSNLCNIGHRGAAIATAIYSPRFGSCDTSGGGVICTCTEGCGLRPGESAPCVAPAGTDCSGGFSGATCCSRPACDVGKPICTCSSGCGLGKDGSSPCACSVGTDCSGSFSGCSCCGAVNLASGQNTSMTGGHTGGAVPDARFGGCRGGSAAVQSSWSERGAARLKICVGDESVCSGVWRVWKLTLSFSDEACFCSTEALGQDMSSP